MRVTRPNLLSWYTSAADVNAFPVAFPDCKNGSLITYPGETTRFYLNLREARDLAPFLAADIITFTKPEQAYPVPADFTFDEVDTDHRTVYGNLPCPNIPPGLYRWRLKFGTVDLYSSVVEVTSSEEAQTYGMLLEYRNSKTLHGIRYPWIDETFEQSLRVRANLIETPPLVETTNYREVTTGRVVPYNAAADWTLTFKTTYTDRDILQGLTVMLLHDDIRLNGKPVTTKDHLSITSSARSTQAVGQFTVYDHSFATPLVP